MSGQVKFINVLLCDCFTSIKSLARNVVLMIMKEKVIQAPLGLNYSASVLNDLRCAVCKQALAMLESTMITEHHVFAVCLVSQ